MIKRDAYIREIEPFINKPLIKVLTGIRRSGKSSILMLLMDELRDRGIRDDQIIHINFDDFAYFDIREDPRTLHDHIKAKMKRRGRYYLLLDEIQEAPCWEQVVNSLLLDKRADIYITGSNSRLLSSELATYIAGRYIEIKVKPLSFAEYRLFKKAYSGESRRGKKTAANEEVQEDFKSFIRSGGFPAVHTGKYTYDQMYQMVNDIYSSALLRDAVERRKIRNVELLERVIKYVFDNVGNTFSAKRVADYFKSQQRKIDLETVYNYLNFLEEAFIIKRISRYDIKGKELLKTNEKYYAGDHSLVYGVMGYKDRMIGGILENIVVHELERRKYRVFTGKLDDKEIDFIGERTSVNSQNEKVYVQVAYTLGNSRSTMEREFAPLLEIRDQYPKYVISMDDFFQDNVEGVKHVSIADFLLMKKY
jgi:predicted AAA+ superfamily ATPase